VRIWSQLHRWCSLVCTAFLLLLCVTGLPLIFSGEIDHWLDHSHYDLPQPGASAPSLDRLVAIGRRMYPGQDIISLFADDDAPVIHMRMAPSLAALRDNPASEHRLRFDAHSGRLLGEESRGASHSNSVMEFLLDLHRRLFAGLAGELFLGTMGLLFIVSIVSGVVLYGPFTRRLDFGTVRSRRSRRVRWLDLHNLLGIATLAWALVVGTTGVMNELATPLFAVWQKTEVTAMLAPYKGMASLDQAHLTSPQRAVDQALRALPGTKMLSIAFPDANDGSPWHYMVWLRGDTPLTARLFDPVLIDARTGELTAVVKMPWYLRALEVSRPLHFGDYGGLPLKVLWTLLDLATILTLGSGLYLWIGKRNRMSAHAECERHSPPSPVELLEPAK